MIVARNPLGLRTKALSALKGILVFIWCALPMSGLAADETAPGKALGETLYVPAYSSIHELEKRRQPLASTLVIHNVDPNTQLELVDVRYHDHTGKMIRSHLEAPVILQPFESANFLTPINEAAGGIGANYIVEWRAKKPALSPIVEAIMIGGTGTHGISFTTRGRVIQRTKG